MVKKILLSALLLISSIAAEQVKIDFNITVKNNPNIQNVCDSVTTEMNEIATFTNDNIIIDFLVNKTSEENDNVIVQTNIYQKEEAVELIAQPTLATTFDKEAIIVIGNDENDLLTFKVNVSKVE